MISLLQKKQSRDKTVKNRFSCPSFLLHRCSSACNLLDGIVCKASRQKSVYVCKGTCQVGGWPKEEEKMGKPHLYYMLFGARCWPAAACFFCSLATHTHTQRAPKVRPFNLPQVFGGTTNLLACLLGPHVPSMWGKLFRTFTSSKGGC